VRVVELRVRPKDFALPLIVGTLFVDAATADLVRLAFNFTPRAYLDPELEDVSIVLDNALWEGRFWLPYRQEIEIRRRATWLDIPARGIIRGRWEIDGYVFNLGLVDQWFAGDEITALRKRHAEAATYLRIDELRARRPQLETEASRPDLWDDADQAREVTGELSSVTDDLDGYDALGGHNPHLHVADDYELLVRTFLGTRMIRVPKLGYIQHRSHTAQYVRNGDIHRHVRAIRTHYDHRIHERLLALGCEDFSWDEARGCSDYMRPNPPIESHAALIATV